MKIAWICHFSNPEIQKMLGLEGSVHHFAPWITYTIPVFENTPEHELHIISPHRYLKQHRSFILRGVHYHFFNPGIPFWGRHWPSLFRWDLFTHYRGTRRMIGKIIRTISPDVIHLQGAENPYYSASILDLKKFYPILINLQRMNLSFDFGSSREGRLRTYYEKRILAEFEHYSIRTSTMERDLKQYNPQAVTHSVRYAIPMLQPYPAEKEHDLVFFARVSPTKGIEDLLKASAIVAKQLGELRVLIIGAVEDAYREYLNSTYACDKLILTWKGVLPQLEDVHREACRAKISVLPTHQDIIPGTIVESMMLGLPVVSTKVGSIPELNETRESLLLVEKGDIDALSQSILRLLQNPEEAATLAIRARQTISEWVGSEGVLEQHISAYRATIETYMNKSKQDRV